MPNSSCHGKVYFSSKSFLATGFGSDPVDLSYSSSFFFPVFPTIKTRWRRTHAPSTMESRPKDGGTNRDQLHLLPLLLHKVHGDTSNGDGRCYWETPFLVVGVKCPCPCLRVSLIWWTGFGVLSGSVLSLGPCRLRSRVRNLEHGGSNRPRWVDGYDTGLRGAVETGPTPVGPTFCTLLGVGSGDVLLNF